MIFQLETLMLSVILPLIKMISKKLLVISPTDLPIPPTMLKMQNHTNMNLEPEDEKRKGPPRPNQRKNVENPQKLLKNH